MEPLKINIRESIFDDLKYFARWESMPEVTEFFTIDEGKTYEMTVREFCEREEDDKARQLTVCLADTDETAGTDEAAGTCEPVGTDTPVGRIYISNINPHYDSLDITRIYIAEPAMRGKGLGEQALRWTLKWAFEEMDCQRVTLDHFIDNMAAASLYEKVGFVEEGVMRCAGKKNGKYVDLRLMSMLKEEYYRRK